MTAIGHGTANATSQTTHTGDTDWTTVLTIDSSNFADDGVYAFWVVAKIHSDDIDNPNAGWRMASGATPTLMPRSFQQIEIQTATAGFDHQHNYFHLFTQPAAAVDVVFQHKVFLDTVTVETEDLHVFWQKVNDDLTLDTDYFTEVDTSGPTLHTTTMVSRLAKTWTPDVANEDWVIFGQFSVDIDTIAVKYEAELFDLTGSTVLALHSREGEDAGETQTQMLIGVLEDLPATAQTVQLRSRDHTATAANLYLEGELFVMRLDAFEDFAVQALGSLSQVDTSPIEANNLEPTPTTAGDWMIVAGVRHNAAGAGNRARHFIQVADVDEPAGFSSNPRYISTFDAADQQFTVVAAQPNFTASVKNIDVDVEWSSSGQSWDDRIAIAWSMELAASAIQQLRPDSDIVVGDWEPTPSSPTTLFDKIDEVIASDTDYISET